MDSKTYMEEIKRTLSDLGNEFDNEFHMVVGVSTEAGELLDTYKKCFAYGKELDSINIEEEIADCFWYLYNLCRMRNLDPDILMQKNVDKLRTRYPDKFDSDRAINRDVTAERKTLEYKVAKGNLKGMSWD